MKLFNKSYFDFCLLQKGESGSYETEYILKSDYLDIQVFIKEINGDNLVLADIIPSGDEKPFKIGRRDMVRMNPQPEVANEDLLKGFSGSILGYPNIRLLVEFTDKSSISCDAIQIQILCSQRERIFTGYFVVPLRIEFYKFTSNGKPEIVKTLTDKRCSFRIKGEEINSQIPSSRGGILSSYYVMDFINGYHRYGNCESYLGNVAPDSKFNYLSFDIDLKRQLLFLSYEENLEYREYEVISYSSMDGNDKGYETTDRYLWAAYRFQSSYHLMKIINQILQIADIVQQESRIYGCIRSIEYSQKFKFKEVMSKSEFESKTGIHLFESIETKNSHYYNKELNRTRMGNTQMLN